MKALNVFFEKGLCRWFREILRWVHPGLGWDQNEIKCSYKKRGRQTWRKGHEETVVEIGVMLQKAREA